MPAPLSALPRDREQGADFRLWTGVLVPPLSGGINTLVGYRVSTYDCSLHDRRLVLAVNGASALLCLLAAAVACSARGSLGQPPEGVSGSLLVSRSFLFRLGMVPPPAPARPPPRRLCRRMVGAGHRPGLAPAPPRRGAVQRPHGAA
jgi:hypothetical protein